MFQKKAVPLQRKSLNQMKRVGLLIVMLIFSFCMYAEIEDPQKMMQETKDKAFAAYCARQYEDAINSYLAYDFLYMTYGDTHPALLYFYASNIQNLAQCYLAIGDSAQYLYYYDRFSQITEMCIDSIMRDETHLYMDREEYERFLMTIISDYETDCFAHSAAMRRRFQFFFPTEKARHYLHLLDKVSSASVLSDEEKEAIHLDTYHRLGKMHRYEANFDSAYYYYNYVITHADFTKYSYHTSVYSDMADLYANVSVEPELSLAYRQQSLSMMTEMLLHHRSEMTREQKIVLYDSYVFDWKKSADQLEYLDDQEGVFRIYEELLAVLESEEGRSSTNYVDTKMDMLGKQARYYAFKQKDAVRARAICDSITYLFEHNREALAPYAEYINYSDIAGNYLMFCKDLTTTERYLKKHEKEIKKAHPKDYQKVKAYIDIQKDRVDYLNGGSKHLNLYDVAAMYKAVPEYQDDYLRTLLHINFDSENLKEKAGLMESILAAHPAWDAEEYHWVYNDLLKTYQALGEYEKMASIYTPATETAREYVFEQFVNATEEKREWIWRDIFQVPFTLAEPLRVSYPEQVSTSLIYDNLLLRKNFLLNSSISAINFIREEGDSLLIAKYNRSLSLQAQLRESKSDSIVSNGRKLSRAQAEALIRRFNEEIMERAAIIGDYTNGMNIDWTDIQQHLQPEDIAIEFSCYRDFKGEAQYAATLLQPTGEPIFVPLFTEKELNRAKDRCYEKTDLSRILWQPLASYFEGVRNIYFSLDGQLYNIAVESIPYWADEKEMMSDRWNMYRLSSTREIALSHPSESNPTAVLYGGIRYNATPTDMYVQHQKYPDLGISGSLAYVRGNASISRADDLPGTKKELEAIHPMLMKQAIKVHVFSGDSANEESFKSLSGKRTHIIHIGTHGFYWSENIAQMQAYFHQKESDEDSAAFADPLNRCGLLFAGANTALIGQANRLEKGVDDGILTAKEISSLDLRGTDIIVLSACETGLGDISGEGVFGLQRGFKKAGVQTILMSLWKVHDAATQLLMTSFYRHYTQGVSKHEALRLAQWEVRNYIAEDQSDVDRSALHDKYKNKGKMGSSEKAVVSSEKSVGSSEKPYASPYYWAGFILLD